MRTSPYDGQGEIQPPVCPVVKDGKTNAKVKSLAVPMPGPDRFTGGKHAPGRQPGLWRRRRRRFDSARGVN